MVDILGPLLFIIFCLAISYWERIKFNTIITPFGALAWPYAVILIMINLGAKHFGFFPVSFQSILFVMIGCIFFLLGGQCVALVVANDRTDSILFKNESNNLTDLLDYYRPLFIFLALVSIISGFIHFHQCINQFGWINIASRDFRDTYGSGLLSHIMLLGRPAFIFLFLDYIYRKKKYELILVILIFLTILARQVKYHIIVFILAGIYFGYKYNLIKINLKKIIKYLILLYLIFNISFVIGFSALDLERAYSSKVQAFLFNHFFTYLFGGPIGFSEILKNPKYPMYSFEEIFAVPINMFRFISGDPNKVDIIISNWISVSNIHRYFHSSNTFGMFGMLYAYIGLYAMFIYLFILGILAYALGYLASRDKKYIGLQLTYVFTLGFLTLSFFGLYFNMLTYIEISFYMLTIPLLYVIGRKIVTYSFLQHQKL